VVALVYFVEVDEVGLATSVLLISFLLSTRLRRRVEIVVTLAARRIARLGDCAYLLRLSPVSVPTAPTRVLSIIAPFVVGRTRARGS
jgi:hypothetical protein